MKYSLRSAGRFTTKKKYALDALLSGVKAVGGTNWLRIAFVLILASFSLLHEPQPIEYARAEATPPVATSTVATTTVIKLSYTKERVQELIVEAFPDAPIMLRVAACESGFLQHAYNPTNNSHDGGVFQISQKYHGHQMKKLGLDPYDVKDNIAYARILYDANGLRDWSASKHCWSK